MLVLSRRVDESIVVGDNISIRVLKIVNGNCVSLGIEAPADVPIWRQELMVDTENGRKMPKRAVKKDSKATDSKAKVNRPPAKKSNFPYKY